MCLKEQRPAHVIHLVGVGARVDKHLSNGMVPSIAGLYQSRAPKLDAGRGGVLRNQDMVVVMKVTSKRVEAPGPSGRHTWSCAAAASEHSPRCLSHKQPSKE